MPYNHAHTRSLGPRHYALTSRPPDHQPQNTAPLFRTPATPPPCSHIGLSSPYMARIELKNSSYSAAVGSASSGSSMSASGPGSGSGSASSSVGFIHEEGPEQHNRARVCAIGAEGGEQHREHGAPPRNFSGWAPSSAQISAPVEEGHLSIKHRKRTSRCRCGAPRGLAQPRCRATGRARQGERATSLPACLVCCYRMPNLAVPRTKLGR